jgi:hypothetical protein
VNASTTTIVTANASVSRTLVGARLNPLHEALDIADIQ